MSKPLEPSKEHLAALANAVLYLLKTTKQTYSIEGQEDPLQDDNYSLQMTLAIGSVEKLLNPLERPFHDHRRRTVVVSNWPDTVGLHTALTQLRGLHDKFIEKWKMQAACAGQAVAWVTEGAIVHGKTAVVRTTKGWRPRIEKSIFEAMEAVAFQLSKSLTSVTQPEPSIDTTKKQLNPTEKRIVALCRRKALPGETIADKIQLTYDHVRHILADLMKSDHLRLTDDGYRSK